MSNKKHSLPAEFRIKTVYDLVPFSTEGEDIIQCDGEYGMFDAKGEEFVQAFSNGLMTALYDGEVDGCVMGVYWKVVPEDYVRGLACTEVLNDIFAEERKKQS